jgi:hypothetical protein
MSMLRTSVAAALSGICLIAAPLSAATAQGMWVPGSEITGHSIQVETNGVVNTVFFDPGGTARIVSPSGTQVQGRWMVEGQNLCLDVGPNARECWPYQAAFQTGQTVTLTSNCAITSRWTPISTEQMIQPERGGERG